MFPQVVCGFSHPSRVYRTTAGRAIVRDAYRTQAERIPFPFETRFIPTSFGETHVLVAGPEGATPLVVLCGVHFGAFFTAEPLGTLASRFRLFIPDIIGQPNLSAETRPDPATHDYAHWLVDVLDHLELGCVRMMGISFGGAVLLDFASVVPTRVSQAAMLVPAGFASSNIFKIFRRLFLPWTLYRFLPRPARVPELVSPLGDGLPAHWYAFFDLLFRHVHWAVRPPGPFTSEQLAGYRAATLAIFARDDCFFATDKAAKTATAVLRKTLVTRVIDGKHLPSASEMETIQTEVLNFLSKTQVAPASE